MQAIPALAWPPSRRRGWLRAMCGRLSVKTNQVVAGSGASCGAASSRRMDGVGACGLRRLVADRRRGSRHAGAACAGRRFRRGGQRPPGPRAPSARRVIPAAGPPGRVPPLARRAARAVNPGAAVSPWAPGAVGPGARWRRRGAQSAPMVSEVRRWMSDARRRRPGGAGWRSAGRDADRAGAAGLPASWGAAGACIAEPMTQRGRARFPSRCREVPGGGMKCRRRAAAVPPGPPLPGAKRYLGRTATAVSLAPVSTRRPCRWPRRPRRRACSSPGSAKGPAQSSRPARVRRLRV